MVYKRVVVWGSFIAQWSCNTIAIACPMQVGGGGQSHDDWLVHKSVEVNEYLVKANVTPYEARPFVCLCLGHQSGVTPYNTSPCV